MKDCYKLDIIGITMVAISFYFIYGYDNMFWWAFSLVGGLVVVLVANIVWYIEMKREYPNAYYYGGFR